ncbi:MAG: ribonuclease D [Rhodobacteraceae bacterium]|nr:ribonuclease D [Paracoccaceae bacterium]
MTLITTTNSLSELCNKLKESEYVTVDTEFIREKTYWPDLCLIQVADSKNAAVVDVLSPNINIEPLLNIMHDPKVLKVFHAARQDLEIFFKLTNRLPQPLFDTQIAAMVCGFGDSVGYDTLVNKITGKIIDKSSRFTDWSLRPLTQKQIDYALGDVTHLRLVYENLNQHLLEGDRSEWLREEVEKLNDTGIYQTSPPDAWKRIKSRNTNPRFLGVLKELASWREKEAQKKNIPRNHVIKDEALVEIAHSSPKSLKSLNRIRGLGQRTAEGYVGQSLLKAVGVGENIPLNQCPQVPRRPSIPKNIGPITDYLKVLLKMKCDEHGIAQKLIANSADIEKLAAFGSKAGIAAISGWRKDLFGEDAINLIEGRSTIIVEEQKLKLATYMQKTD